MQVSCRCGSLLWYTPLPGLEGSGFGLGFYAHMLLHTHTHSIHMHERRMLSGYGDVRVMGVVGFRPGDLQTLLICVRDLCINGVSFGCARVAGFFMAVRFGNTNKRLGTWDLGV